jgi:hypothetical protein
MTARVLCRQLLVLTWGLACQLAPARGDEFDRYTGSVLVKVPASEGVTELDQIPFNQLLQTKSILGRDTGCFFVVRTDQGNWAKLVVSPSYRKHEDGEVPLVHVQRYQCMRPGSENGKLSAGKDVYVFDTFQFDLDIGQIVPPGGGGDIVFERAGSAGVVRPVGRAKLYLLSKPLVDSAPSGAGPSAGPVVAEDFAGKFHLFANGKWSGQLTLRVSNSGELNGSYVSEQTGADYPVKGFVARPMHHVKFTIELPMAQQEFDGYLWMQGKNVIAGTMTLAGGTFGFVAVREGAELVPQAPK